MYLIIANQIGLVGLGIYLSMIAAVFIYGMRGWHWARLNPDLDAIHLGVHAALLALVVNGIADMYFFRLDFQGSINILWLVIALSLTTSHLALQNQPLPNQNASSKIVPSLS